MATTMTPSIIATVLAVKIRDIQTNLREICQMNWNHRISKAFNDYISTWSSVSSSLSETTPLEHKCGYFKECVICASTKRLKCVQKLSERFHTCSLKALEELRQQVDKQINDPLYEKEVNSWCDYITERIPIVCEVVFEFKLYLDRDTEEYWDYEVFVSRLMERIRAIYGTIFYIRDNCKAT